jgi:hypothetical protein
MISRGLDTGRANERKRAREGFLALELITHRGRGYKLGAVRGEGVGEGIVGLDGEDKVAVGGGNADIGCREGERNGEEGKTKKERFHNLIRSEGD